MIPQQSQYYFFINNTKIVFDEKSLISLLQYCDNQQNNQDGNNQNNNNQQNGNKNNHNHNNQNSNNHINNNHIVDNKIDNICNQNNNSDDIKSQFCNFIYLSVFFVYKIIP